MDASRLRILDAAANRAREALRVLEDVARFAWDDAGLTGRLKALRHDLAAALGMLPMERGLQSRDTAGDVGTGIKTEAEFSRAGMAGVLAANTRRLTEALRTLEEVAKTFDGAAAARLEQLRYRAYTLEKEIGLQAVTEDGRARFARVRLVVLLTESLCVLPWEKVLDEILAAGGNDAARLCIQLREKELEDGELLGRARRVAERCRGAGGAGEGGAISMINDRADIALLAGADGVHVGQGDLPLAEVKRIWVMGARGGGITGISTENLAQARSAAEQGPTYIAAGPMFPTTTKDKPRIVGPAYAAELARELKLPLVAIGGITPENAREVLAAGATALAVSSVVLRSEKPREVVARLLAISGTAE
ncbi:MAG TPA: thiamine phosphate synthase [Phycisphaerae bacterium]|jgi:thiamine-phosphate pyrophosphorylase|nr:thiamine phosphate synthase [Phycisphaerae bacterium]